MAAQPKVAIVCDWLTNMGGAERVVLALLKAYPDAPIYTSVFEAEACPTFKGLDVRTTWLQKFPKFLRRKHQLFPVLRALAFRKLNLSGYNIIISSASAEAKSVVKRPGAVHICYCHTPTRYYWSHYEEYKKQPGFGLLNPLIRLLIPPFVAWMRRADLQAVAGVDHFIANSSAVADRIKIYYERDSQVIYAPVNMERFRGLAINEQRYGFLIVGRQVAYKRFDIAVEVCNALKLPLTLIGDGPEHKKLRAVAGPTIKFITGATDQDVAQAMTKAKAFLSPQEEDFGITQIEAMAAGCPVIAYAKGGSLDAVVEGKTGLFFNDQTPESLQEALKRFELTRFTPKILQMHAEEFSEERFVGQIQEFVSLKN
jgi:glycosyltransferase involved in cell wall biosynthesis